jgi:hypothetical protein
MKTQQTIPVPARSLDKVLAHIRAGGVIRIHFQANFLPNQREFNVTVRFGKRRLFEKMTIAKFLRFARQADKPLVVDGYTITFDGGQEAEKHVRDYLRKVADTYVEANYRNN